MKTWTVFATLPELSASIACHKVTVQATKPNIAVYRALKEILRSPGVLRKRITQLKVSIVLQDGVHSDTGEGS